MSQIAHIFVTIERSGDSPRIRHWTGKNAASIKKAAREKYSGCSLQFGKVWYTNHYGAH